MPRLSQIVRVAVLIALVGGAGVLAWRAVRKEPMPGRFRTYAMFRDASGLPIGSRVVIAGVPVGEIAKLTIEGRLARVDMRLGDDIVLWDNAYAEKKISSLLGDNYIEINPGGADESSDLPDSVEPTTGRRVEHPPPQPGPRRRLRSGERIPHVVEGSSTDAMLREIDRTMPVVDTALDDFRVVINDARKQVNGDLVARLEAADAWLGSTELSRGLADFDDQMGRFEDWTIEAGDATDGLAPRTDRWLDDTATSLVDLRGDLAEARDDVARTLGDLRADLDDVDPYVSDAARWLAPLDDPQDEGGLARAINDGELGETIADGTEGATSLFGTVGNLKTYVGLRTEFNILAAQPRFYVTAQVYTRPDKFYLIELEKGALGGEPDTRLVYSPDGASYTRRVVIAEELRFTVQLGKRIDWLSLRFGLKESAMGIGADADLWGGRLKVSSDVFGNSFNRLPRVKLAAAMEVFRMVYVVAGIDDVLTDGGTLAIAPYPEDPGVPIQFEEVRYGRDYFVGAMLHFTEKDLATMLTVYGAALVALL